MDTNNNRDENNNYEDENQSDISLNDAINDLERALKNFDQFPEDRDIMWDVILNNELRYTNNTLMKIKRDYIYNDPKIYSYAKIVSFIDNNSYIFYGKDEKKMSLLSQNNAKNIILLNELNDMYHCILMNTHMHGNDFVAIELFENNYLTVLNIADNRLRYIHFDDIRLINNILLKMQDEKTCQYVFKLSYHNIEAKSNVLSEEKFNFSDMMTAGSLFKDTHTDYMPTWHELLYMENKPLPYDGFIKTLFDKNSNANVTLSFLSKRGGSKLSFIVQTLRKIFQNSKIFLNDISKSLSEYYMKVETWMLYCKVKWHLKLFNGWVNSTDDDSVVSQDASLRTWCEKYANVNKDEFYNFIKKRLIFIFTIYAQYRNAIKEQLLKYLEKIRLKSNIKDDKQIFIENILNRENLLYKFQNAQSTRLTGAISSSTMLSSNEIETYLNAIIGSDKDFINNLKLLGYAIIEDDQNIFISDEEYEHIIKGDSDLNSDFSKFRKPWKLLK